MRKTANTPSEPPRCRALRGAIALCAAVWLTVAATASAGDVVINEFVALNGGSLTNALGKTDDWIEIRNRSAAAVDLTGWHLTDAVADPAKWVFPPTTLPANGFLLVWADGGKVSVVSNELHASFKLDGDGEYLALVRPDGATVEHAYAPAFPEQREDISYGLDAAGTPRYFSHPTPGAANDGAFAGYVADTSFSRDRGFYTNAFDVVIACATTGAVIRYTTDGSTPTSGKGQVYTVPVRIARSTVLRAAAFLPGYAASDVDTQTYLFLADVLRQSGAGLPAYGNWGHAGPDWAVNPALTNTVLSDAQGRAFNLKDALLDLPAVSLVTDWSNWWSNAPGPALPDGLVPWQGIYADPVGESDVKRPVSMEFFTPDRAEAFALNGSVHVVGGGIGGTSADRWKSDKLSLRVAFREEYGPARLNYPVFGADAASSFDTLVLDAHLAWSWHHAQSAIQRTAPKLITDALGSDLQNAMSDNRAAPHSRFVHLYLNGLYWGVYELHERPDEHFAAQYFGGNDDAYDSIKHVSNDTSAADDDHDGDPYNDNLTNGDDAHLLAMLALSRRDLSVTTNYAAVAAVLDVDAFIDYLLLNFFVGNNDWAHKNWFATRNREDPAGRWRYHSWDVEHILETSFTDPSLAGALTCNVTGKDDAGGPTELHQNLRANPAYRLRFADRVHRHFFNAGPLSAAGAAAIFQARVEEVERAMLAEAARWGDNCEPHYQPEWVAHMQDLLNNYFPLRGANVLGQLAARGLYPATPAPECLLNGVRQHGGAFPDGAALTFESARPVYYTLDGTDPRDPATGNPAGTLCGGSVTLPHAVRLKARALDAGVWSALTEAVFVPAAPAPLRITEIMYAPRPPRGAETNVAESAADFEFIEFANTGARTVGLAGLSFDTGIRYAHTNTALVALAPGACALIVRNPAAFARRYPAAVPRIAGAYQRLHSFPLTSLADGGERLVLRDGLGRALADFAYGAGPGWPAASDGAGHALVPLVLTNQVDGALDSARNWRQGTLLDGSPGAADPAPAAAVVINEFAAHTDTGLPPPADSDDWIELYNPLAQPAAVGGWYLSDSADDLRKARLPAAAVIPAGGFLYLSENTLFHTNRVNGSGFGLDKAGEALFLSCLPGDGTDRVVDGVRFAGQENGATWGRYPDGGAYGFVLTPTPAAANVAPPAGVVISEVMYEPAGGASDRAAAFVEVANTSDRPLALWTEAGPWRLSGLGYTFPTGLVLAAGAYLAVVGFDPATNAAALAAFRATYALTGLPVHLAGPFDGALDRAGERLALERPQAPDVPGDSVSWVVVDEVAYVAVAPWPAAAAGGGSSLARRLQAANGNDPARWQAAADPTPGGPPRVVSLTYPLDGAVLYAPLTSPVTAAVDAERVPGIGRVRFLVNGTPAAVATAAPFEAFPAALNAEGTYTLAAELTDTAGVVCTSRLRTVTVYGLPPDRGTHKLRIAFAGRPGTETLAGFVAQVRLGARIPGFDYRQFASPRGLDLRFTDAGETAFLPYEIESWNTNGEAVVWLRLPALPPGGTQACAYWGDPALAQAPPYTTDGSAWSEGYAGVWHLSAGLADSAAGVAMADHGSTAGEGAVAGGRTLDGSAAYLAPGLDAAWYQAHQADMTVSFWARPAASQTNTVFGAVSGSARLQIRLYGGRTPTWGFSLGGADIVTTPAAIGAWQHLALTLHGGAFTPYLNGVAVHAARPLAALSLAHAPLFGCLNAAGTPTGRFNGRLDELRLSHVSRSADWLRAAYQAVAIHDTVTAYQYLPPSAQDADADALPDRWEIESFGATNAVAGGALEDWDGDGISNHGEYVAGTDPKDGRDVFALHVVVTNGARRIAYRTVLPGPDAGGRQRWYDLLSAGQLPPEWAGVPGHVRVPATGGWSVYTGAVPERVFFRGRVRLE